jgi:hypothetical protein
VLFESHDHGLCAFFCNDIDRLPNCVARSESLGRLIAAEHSAQSRDPPGPGLSRFLFARIGFGRMKRFEIELLSKDGPKLLGAALDAEGALNAMDDAIRKYPDGHIRMSCGTKIAAERIPPRPLKNV